MAEKEREAVGKDGDGNLVIEILETGEFTTGAASLRACADVRIIDAARRQL